MLRDEITKVHRREMGGGGGVASHPFHHSLISFNESISFPGQYHSSLYCPTREAHNCAGAAAASGVLVWACACMYVCL